MAEHERHKIDDFFVETDSYYRALEGPTTILVGRKGTGKTAILFAMQATLGRDRNCHVCVMKPVGYETHGPIRVLDEIRHQSERGYLIESLWKYLVYSELALSVQRSIMERPNYLPTSEEEVTFLGYCENNKDILDLPFSERLDTAVKSLKGIGELTGALQQRARISERLHAEQLRDLRKHLGLVLADKEQVAILIDNLDDPWAPGSHIHYLSDLLAGLLGVVQDIPDDFRRGHHWKPVEVRVTVLLRSDIFSFVQPLTVEQDKLPLQRVVWDDRELLLRVVGERLIQGAPKSYVVEDVWSNLFPAEVVGVSPSEFICRTVLPRPRDVIYLVKEAIGIAINRGHSSVLEEDLLEARERYSEFVFRSILAEDDPQKGKLEAVLYEFAGAGRNISRIDVENRMAEAGVDGSDTRFYINLLCGIGFSRDRNNCRVSLRSSRGPAADNESGGNEVSCFTGWRKGIIRDQSGFLSSVANRVDAPA